MTAQAMMEPGERVRAAGRSPCWLPAPVTRRLALAARPSSVRHARHHVLRALRLWGWEVLADTAELLVSELVTNAVKISGGRSCDSGGRRGMADMVQLTLRRTRAGLVMEVWDTSSSPPVPRTSQPLEEDGRGLELVASLSSDWGHYVTDGGGKVVWCEIRLPGPR